MPAATATTRRAPPSAKALKTRQALVEELLGLHIRHADAFARMEAIEAELKADASATDGFKLEVAGKGSVAVSGALAKEFKGDVPQIVTEAWAAMPPAAKKRLVKDGLVVVVPQWSKASYGRVTVKVF